MTGPDRRLEHEVEVARLGEIAVRALAGVLARLLRAGRVLEVVGAEAVLADAAVDHRVGEAADVARGLPDARMQHQRRVERDDVVALLHHRAQPGGLDVALHEHAVVRVVVGRAEAAVDLRGREDEAAAAAERDDGVHRHGLLGSGVSLTPAAYRALSAPAAPGRTSCRVGAHAGAPVVRERDLADPAAAACRPRARSARRRCTCRLAALRRSRAPG